MKLDLESDGNETFGSGSGCYKFGGLQDYALRILGLPAHEPVRGATRFGGLQDSGGYKITHYGFWVRRTTNGF